MQSIKNKRATLTILNLPTFKGVADKNLRLLLNNLVLEVFSFVAENERQ